MAGTSNSITTHNVLSGVLNADNVISGLVNTAFNPAYALVTQAGAQIVLFINSNDYKMYAQLKDKSGNLIYTSNIIDLPLETMVVDGRYDSNTKKLILVLDNGNEIKVPLEALINGLVNEDDLIANYYDKDEIDALLNGYWTKIELTQEDIDNWNAKQEYLNQGDGIEISADTILKGNTSQESTTGKNLLNIFNFEMGSMSNGSIMSSPYRINNVNNPIEVKPNTTYCISSVLSTQVKGMRCGIHECDENMTFKKDSGWQQLATNPYVFTTENYTKYVKIVFTLSTISTDVQTNTTEDVTSYNNAIDWARGCLFQLEEGNTATSWEKYTGGTPAPNPDYPYPVNVVTGDNEVKVEGKNLLNIPSDYSVTGNTTINITLPAGTYHISCGNVVKGGTNAPAFTGFGAWFNLDPNTDTIRTLNETTQLTIRVYSNGYSAPDSAGVTSIINNLMISISGGEYEPYQSQTYPINLGSMELCKIGDYQDYIAKSTGKNLFDKATIDEGHYINQYGTLGTDATAFVSDYIEITPNTNYYISNRNIWVSIGLYDSSKTFLERISLTTANGILNVTNTSCKYVRVNASLSDKDTLMINKGTTALPYEPYGKVWCKYGAIGKHTITDSDVSLISSYWYSTYGQYGAGIPKANLGLPETTTNRQSLCNVSNKINGQTNIANNTYIFNANANYVFFFNSGFDTKEHANAKLVGADVYYNLDTPTITEITDTTLIEQLDNLSIGLSNKWIKNISQTNAEIPFELEYDNTNLTISANLTDYYTKTETNTLLNEKVGFTDYGTTDTGGVIRDGTTSLGYEIVQTGANVGKLGARILSYTQYQNNLYTNGFIGKGTLNNVLDARIGDIQTLLDNLNTGSGV